jgi:hypothetical protein
MYLAGDKDVFPFYDPFSYLRSDAGSSFLLVFIKHGAVNMAVSNVNGIFNNLLHLSWA